MNLLRGEGLMLLPYLTVFESENDKNSLTVLYQYYEAAMYNIAYSILHDKYLAEDAINETFIKLIKYLPDIDNIYSHKTKALLVIILKNTAIDIYRKRKKQYEYETEERDDVSDNDDRLLDQIIADENHHEFMLKLNNLKKEYQEIILLKYVYELSNSEIGNLLSMTDSVVRQHICRAKKAVKKIIIEEGN